MTSLGTPAMPLSCRARLIAFLLRSGGDARGPIRAGRL